MRRPDDIRASDRLDASIVLASLDPNERHHQTCDRAVAARKADVDRLLTLDLNHFQALTRKGDPRIEAPV